MTLLFLSFFFAKPLFLLCVCSCGCLKCNPKHNMAEDAPLPPLTIASPYPDHTAAFDNRTEDHFADVEVLLSQSAGEPPRPLLLHRVLLSRTSHTFAALFRGEAVGTVCYNAATRRVEGLGSSVPGDVMVCWLRFCYGAPMHVEVRTAVAALAALLWLRLRCSECQLQQVLEDFIVRAAGHEIQTGVALLQQCVACPACHSNSNSRVDCAVARCVLTRHNLEAHRDIVMDCLVKLPAEYLGIAEYGAPHTECSEFSVRVAYLKHNRAALNDDEKRHVLPQSVLTQQSASVLNELCGVVDYSELVLAQETLLARMEKETEEASERADTAKKEVKELEHRVQELKTESNMITHRCKHRCQSPFFVSVQCGSPDACITATDKGCVDNWVNGMAKRGFPFAVFANEYFFPFLDEKVVANPFKPPDTDILKFWATFLRSNIAFTRSVCQDCEYQQTLKKEKSVSDSMNWLENRCGNDQGRCSSVVQCFERKHHCHKPQHEKYMLCLPSK